MKAVEFSGIRKMMEKAQQLEQEGKRVIHLEIGRPDFDTPAHIKATAAQALAEGYVHYTSNYGIIELRHAIADKLRLDNGLEFDPQSEIIVTAGANEGVFLAIMATVNPGDEVLVPDPSWLNYFYCVALAGGRAVSVPLREENGFRLDAEDVVRAITPRTRMLLVVSPHNPTGAVLTEAGLRALASLARERNLLVLADEIYEKLIYDGIEHHSIGRLPGMRERVKPSKNLTLAGFVASLQNLTEVVSHLSFHVLLLAL